MLTTLPPQYVPATTDSMSAFRGSRSLIGSVQRQRDRRLVGVVQTGHDFSQRDRILPHPVYGWMCWIAVLNPSHETFEEVKPLLSALVLILTAVDESAVSLTPSRRVLPDTCSKTLPLPG